MKSLYRLLICFFLSFYIFSTYCVVSKADNNKHLSSCLLIDRNTIELKSSIENYTESNDGLLYLYGLYPYEYEITKDSILITTISFSTSPSITFSLYDEASNTRLYNKFVFAILENDNYVMVTTPIYINNPEFLGLKTEYGSVRSLKSIQGIDFWNVETSSFCAYPDTVTTLQLMNSNPSGEATSPSSQGLALETDQYPTTVRYYYMPNSSSPDSIYNFAEICTMYASDTKIKNFILGNEVNARIWNYSSWIGWDNYIREYAQAFRVAYNAIKSVNANANIYLNLDMTWDQQQPTTHYNYYRIIDGKEFLNIFNSIIAEEGNIDWGLSQHPYLLPLTQAMFWKQNNPNVENGKNVTFQNLSVITDFLQTPEMLSPSGTVRHFIISEIGITNSQGEKAQAAALLASHIAVKQNPYVEEVIYLLAYCLQGVDTRLSGFSKEIFDNMDGENADYYEEWAKEYMNINDWNEILK